jgi:hypothetical protein
MLERLARLGYASKALIYAIVGVLAVLTATNRGGRITDTDGALRVALMQPFGRLLLIVLAVGLCGYAIWRLLDAGLDPDRHGTSAGGLATRIGNAVRGCVYGALGVDAIQLLRGVGGPKRDQPRIWIERLFDWPMGEVLVAVVGASVALYGGWQIHRSVHGEHDEKLDWSRISAPLRAPLRRISVFGVAVRGGLLAMLGVFAVRAALTHDSSVAIDSRESLLRLGGLVEGRWFLAVVALGVIAYAVDQGVHAYCRRIRPVV